MDTTQRPGDSIDVRLLEGDTQAPLAVAGWLADFIGRARRSLDIAIYDCRLSDGPARVLRDALAERRTAGVAIRLVYDVGDKPQDAAAIDEHGVEPAPRETHERVGELGLPDASVRAIHGLHALMHHKYVVRDGEHVWTGSLNLSDDSFRRMENMIVTVDSRQIATYFSRDFAQLWDTGRIEASGDFATEPARLTFAGAPAVTDVDFSPGQGIAINARIAARVASARRRVVICSMLFTSSRLLRALTNLIDGGRVELSGVYDGTQMAGVLNQWRQRADLEWKVAAVERIVTAGKLVGKRSTPYRPDASHDFLHVKAIVVDDTVLTGSHNFSHAAQANAENVLAIESPALAEQVVAYAHRLGARYR